MRARTCRRHLAAAVVGVGLGIAATGSPAFAAERALELVTPPGNDPRVLIGGGMATPDGNVVCFNSEREVAGSTSNGVLLADDGFCARRTASGWETEWVTGPAPREFAGGRGAQVYWVSPDGARVVFASDTGIYPDYRGDAPGGSGVGTPSAFMWEGGDMPRWLAPTPEPLVEDRPNGMPGLFVKREAVAASEDLRHGVFYSSLRLLAQDTNTELDVYEWTPDGIRLVTRDASGNAVGGTPPLGTITSQMLAQQGTMSRNGSRIFFHSRASLLDAPGGVQSVFMREGDDLTHVSPRRGPGPPVPQDVHFVGASENGEIVYLLSAEQLTSDPLLAGSALYRYEVGGDRLSLVATDATGIFFLGTSTDGSTAVYRTGARALRVHRDGIETSLVTLATRDVPSTGMVGSTRYDNRALRIAPDGSAIVYSAFFDGTPTARSQVYRWTPEDGVRRISAKADASAPRADATIGNFSTLAPGSRQLSFHTTRQFPNVGRVLTDDGRIFFETPESLLSEDVNEYIDVYEWDDGVVRLVSPGTQRADAYYHDNSADGSTVFFTTDARLIPELDRNVSSDLYAARIGGGFPLPAPPVICGGDDCQGGLAAPPALPRSGSIGFEGPGNADESPAREPRHRLLALTAKQRGAFSRRGRTVLRVRLTDRGWVAATATARIGGRNVRVARTVRSGQGGRVVGLRLTLSKRARAQLRRRGVLRIVISVSYSQSDTTIRRVVVLRG